MKKKLLLIIIAMITSLAIGLAFVRYPALSDIVDASHTQDQTIPWLPPDTLDIPHSTQGDLIRYGRKLIANTSVYLGPNGIIARLSNGMDCQNCHLNAGTKTFGNNYAAVNSTYPKFRARSGTVESIEKRVNDCIERSLNGTKLDVSSREMQAMVAYIKWVGGGVKKDVLPDGSGILSLPLLDRAANPEKGLIVYTTHCRTCHGTNGRGRRIKESSEWEYPPLAGDSSYNIGAGIFRLSKFAGYVKANMPYGVSYDETILTDEEAWDVAAYINSLPRPDKDISNDWPDISQKPFDHPFGPFVDRYSEEQHKYGPFKPITTAGRQ